MGDLLGSYIGKSRLSIFKLRPRRTAVLVTVLTGSLISAFSFGFMILVNKQLRVGLFELNQLQKERSSLEQRIKRGAKELKQLETNIIALRKGDVVISTGQILAYSTFSSSEGKGVVKFINRLLQNSNKEAFRLSNPKAKPDRQIILVPRLDIKRLEEILIQDGSWVVNIRSAANVLLGEELVYAFPEIRPNKIIVKEGEVLSRISFQLDGLTLEEIRKQIKLLFASTLAEVKRRGSITSGIQFNSNQITSLSKRLVKQNNGEVKLQSFSRITSNTADPIVISIQIENTKDLGEIFLDY
tara:strand:- start:1240 stop:2136 length:897 start_codon:yes stop_codon:yes gene_type:complete